MKNFNKKNLIIAIIVLGLIIATSTYFFTKDNHNVTVNSNDLFFENEVLENPAEEKIAVHVTGEVNNPGLFYLKSGARIIDAIDAASGATAIADLNKINLAYELQDAQKIYVPSIYDEQISEYVTDNAGNNVIESSSSQNNKLININTASQNELDSLPGIGASTANKIIDYRNKNGKFKKIEDIMNVSGIGQSKFDNIKSLISV